MGLAPLEWGTIMKWANKFYRQDKIVMLSSKTVKKITKNIRGKEKVEIEETVSEIPTIISDITLKDYELEIIMQLSREYCHEYSAATDPHRECPKEIFLDEIDAEANANALHDMFMKNWGVNQVNTKPEIIRNE